MSARNCPYCRGTLLEGRTHCIWCGADVSQPPQPLKPGDILRIRNPFKGGHVEEVTVVRVERDGWAIEVRDQRGIVWGYIKPADVLEIRRGSRSA